MRILADEHLTGASRDAVQARLDLWLKAHMEKLLGPLFALASAEDITGIARGVAFQLTEALGVLERQQVAEDVKGLDQTARAALRKYGVRFGAYHFYLPDLLKPGPRALATQLWALKDATPETKGLDDVAASRRLRPHLVPGRQGRAEGALPRGRLSRLRRARGARRYPRAARRSDPPGARLAAGRAGAEAARRGRGRRLHRHGQHDVAHRLSGEDFASVLRSLGYRMEKKPKPTEPPPAAVKAVPAEESPPGMSSAPEALPSDALSSETLSSGGSLAGGSLGSAER